MLLSLIELIENPLFALVILPILIFLARVADVTLGTLRIVFISQGKRKLAPIMGFFEIFIWLIAVGQIFSNLTNLVYYFAYAGGFAMGNYIGLVVENKLSLGLLSLHLIVRDDSDELIKTLKEKGYGLTILTTEGIKSNVKLVVMIIKRKNQLGVLEIIRRISPNTFISIENVQSVKGGKFPLTQKTRWYLLRRKKV